MNIKNIGICLLLIFYNNISSVVTLSSDNKRKIADPLSLPAQELKLNENLDAKEQSRKISFLAKLIIKFQNIYNHVYVINPMTDLDTNRFDA